jgi:hypothetical protein
MIEIEIEIDILLINRMTMTKSREILCHDVSFFSLVSSAGCYLPPMKTVFCRKC